MSKLMLSFIATMCILFLGAYDFLSLCRLSKKGRIIGEKMWENVFPKANYNENILYVFIRPIFLTISMLFYLFTAQLVNEIFIYQILIILAPILSILNLIKTIK